ncbi:MAG: hypothetical protein PHT60_11370 [Acidiphilium sp.]|nr:hypothetical protein [Acidiphilium sp.]MDD4936363.1 hypothetical protein [Acidiphilium sp.]
MSSSKLRLLKPAILLTAIATSLAACGTEAPHRMGTGTAGGAATGAAFGLIGGPIGVVVGAAIGGGIGALTASTTTPKQINLDNIGTSTTSPAPAGGNGPASDAAQPGLRNQINQYQTQSGYNAPPTYGQPQSLSPAAPAAGYGQGVQSQPLAPPNPQ